MKYLLTLILFLIPASVLAAGIQVSPEKLQFAISDSKTQSQEITVANPTADVQLFQIYPDDFDRAIKSNPASFTLEAGASKRVQITVDPSQLPNGTASTTLSILSKPLAAAGVSINTGIKIPITITTGGKRPQKNWIYPLGIILLLILIGFGQQILQRRKIVRP